MIQHAMKLQKVEDRQFADRVGKQGVEKAWSDEARESSAEARSGGKSHKEISADYKSAHGHEGVQVLSPRKSSGGYTEATIKSPEAPKGYLWTHPDKGVYGGKTTATLSGQGGHAWVDGRGENAKEAISDAHAKVGKLKEAGLWDKDGPKQDASIPRASDRGADWMTRAKQVLGHHPAMRATGGGYGY